MTRAVYDAWHDAGLIEHYHRHAQDRLRATWPTLANALDVMPRAADGQEKPELPVCGPFALYLHGECYSDGYETLDAVLVDALELAADRDRDHDEQGGIEVRSVPAAPVGGQAELSWAEGHMFTARADAGFGCERCGRGPTAPVHRRAAEPPCRRCGVSGETVPCDFTACPVGYPAAAVSGEQS